MYVQVVQSSWWGNYPPPDYACEMPHKRNATQTIASTVRRILVLATCHTHNIEPSVIQHKTANVFWLTIAEKSQTTTYWDGAAEKCWKWLLFLANAGKSQLFAVVPVLLGQSSNWKTEARARSHHNTAFSCADPILVLLLVPWLVWTLYLHLCLCLYF